MRLTGLILKRYGPFEDLTLDFDPSPGRINLVLAPNGAGKSVLRHAFGELLFGIGGQTPMGFRYGYPGMQLSASGLGPDGAAFAFTRRKGNKNTLSGDGEVPLEQSWLDRLLGRADARLLSQLFALDTERLRQGGRDLLSSGGTLADALIAAAGGLREASVLRRSLDDERDRLAPTRKTASRPFYVALERWSESRRQLRESLVRPREWSEREKQLQDAAALRDASNRAVTEARMRVRRLERVRRVRPLLASHAMASAWFEANPHAPRLLPELSERLPAARGAVAHGRHTVETARAFLERLDADIAEAVPDDALLAVADELRALLGMVGLVEQATAGLPGAEAALERARERVREHAAALGHPDAADPAALIPPPALVAQLRRLLAELAAKEATLSSLPRRAAEQGARLAEAEQCIAKLPPPEDVRQLEALLAEIRREGDPSRNLASAKRVVAEANARLSDLLARLPASLRHEERLEALDLPTPAALERLSGTRDRARLALEGGEEAVRKAEHALSATRTEQAALEEAGAPPTREELARARARREVGWDRIFRRLSGEAPDPEGEREYGGGRPLTLAYHEAVVAADRIADARLADAQRAVQAERLVRVLSEREGELALAKDGAGAARKRFEVAQASWAAAVTPLGLDGDAGLAEVERLMSAREAALAAMQAFAGARAALVELETFQDAAAARILRLLDRVEAASLPLLLDNADASVRQHHSAQERRREHLAVAAAARDAIQAIEQEREEATEGLARWRAEWTGALERLGQPSSMPPHSLEGVLDTTEALAASLREVATLEAEATSWREALQRFGTGYEAVHRRLGSSPEPEALAGLRELDRRYRGEAALAERRSVLLERRAKEVDALRGQEDALARAEATLRAVMAAAGAATAEGAEERIALSAERARQEAVRAEAEAAFLTTGDGLSFEELRSEAAAEPAEGLEAALVEAEEAQRGHAAAAQSAVAQATELELELRRLQEDDAALRAAATEAAAAGQLGQTLEDALLMQVAAGLLDAALGAVQKGGDDALLRRIGAAFAELTEGAYTGVHSREDERGTARLILRSRDLPEGEIEVDQLSEGTRDQLFLALRLVAIADQAASGTVVPFVGDDILQSFDDRRAAAAFRALLRLSETTQVILLSHHEHLLGVLQTATPPSSVHIQRVGA